MMLDVELPKEVIKGSCMNVTEIIGKLTEMDTPHEDQKWEDMFKDMEFYDDVHKAGHRINPARCKRFDSILLSAASPVRPPNSLDSAVKTPCPHRGPQDRTHRNLE